MSAPADRPPVQAVRNGGDQLQPQDSLIDRGVNDMLDAGWSPPEQPYAPTLFVGAHRDSDRELEADPGFGADTEADLIAMDVGLSGGAASAEEAAEHIIDDLA
jgi:hypothetical protein